MERCSSITIQGHPNKLCFPAVCWGPPDGSQQKTWDRKPWWVTGLFVLWWDSGPTDLHSSFRVLFGFAKAVPVCALSPLTAPARRLKCQPALPFFNPLVLTDVEQNRSTSIGFIMIRQCDVTLPVQCFSFFLFSCEEDVMWEEKMVKNIQSFLVQLGTSPATLHGSHHLLSGDKYSPTNSSTKYSPTNSSTNAPMLLICWKYSGPKRRWTRGTLEPVPVVRLAGVPARGSETTIPLLSCELFQHDL